MRVNAQLIDARNDAHLWAQTYDRDLADVFAIQSEIAKAIADQLQAKLSPTEKAAIEQRPTTDLVAFDLYTRAKAPRLSTMTFNVLASENLLRRLSFSIKRWSVIRRFCWPGASWPARMIAFTFLASTIRLPALPWPKPLCKRRCV